MILMVFDLGDTRQLVMPAEHFVSICDNDNGQGSSILYLLDDGRMGRIESKIPAAKAIRYELFHTVKP